MKFQELEEYYKIHHTPMTDILKRIEMKFVNARDNEGIPVYMTRARIKNIESSYLKTKRKDKKEIMSITDLIGLRILCLFEQDILGVYKFILEMCCSDVYKLEEILIFGLKKESRLTVSSFKKELNKFDKYKNIDFRSEARENGYQSIHFVGTYQDFEENTKYPFEIQLRTLLQDVWGELEHKLAYKQKSSHPFIKKSFIRLSKALETNDMLISDLQDINEDFSCGVEQIPFTLGNVLKYEEERLPIAFMEKGLIEKEYRKYKNIVYGEGFLRLPNIEEGKVAYRKLITLYNKERPANDEDFNFNYWKEMEKAFFDIYDEEFDNAKSIYYKYMQTGSYVSAYRLGQIYLYEGRLIKALRKFDTCFDMLDERCHHINQMKLHVNMALIFWNLGSDYLTSTIKSIKQAIISTEDTIDDYDNRDLETLYNSACWYYMECHFNDRCLKKEKESNVEATKYYEKLLDLTSLFHSKNTVARKHTYDTLAWYNYQRFIEGDREDVSLIKEAYKYMLKMNNGMMPVTQYYSHEAIQNNHNQKINCEYKKIFIKN